MAKVVARDLASVFPINDSMGEEGDIFSCNDPLVIEGMLGDVPSSREDLDCWHSVVWCGVVLAVESFVEKFDFQLHDADLILQIVKAGSDFFVHR
jgi:hypothetical protein